MTAEGKHLTASPAKNKDLYWALSGGGGGTYAAVVSVTVRAHKLTKASAANLSFTNAGVSQSVFYKAIKTFLLLLPKLSENGIWSTWLMGPNFFSIIPAFGPELSRSQLQTLLTPLLKVLNGSSIAYGKKDYARVFVRVAILTVT